MRLLRLKSIVSAAIFVVMGFAGNNVAAADNPNPYLKKDDTWISISGTVDSVSRDAFVLDYGEGDVTVEMDDGDRDADAYKLIEGDKVTVNGVIDDDFYELTTIEAESVYVEKIDTYFYASSVDEEDYTIWYARTIVPGDVTIQGEVTKVNGDSFIINTGLSAMKISVENMDNNPLDNKGYQKVEKGDFVRVSAIMDDDLFDSQELKATSIITLID